MMRTSKEKYTAYTRRYVKGKYILRKMLLTKYECIAVLQRAEMQFWKWRNETYSKYIHRAKNLHDSIRFLEAFV